MHTCDCGNPKPPKSESCPECAAIDRAMGVRRANAKIKTVQLSIYERRTLTIVGQACDDFMRRRGLRPVTLCMPEF